MCHRQQPGARAVEAHVCRPPGLQSGGEKKFGSYQKQRRKTQSHPTRNRKNIRTCSCIELAYHIRTDNLHTVHEIRTSTLIACSLKFACFKSKVKAKGGKERLSFFAPFNRLNNFSTCICVGFPRGPISRPLETGRRAKTAARGGEREAGGRLGRLGGRKTTNGRTDGRTRGYL